MSSPYLVTWTVGVQIVGLSEIEADNAELAANEVRRFLAQTEFHLDVAQVPAIEDIQPPLGYIEPTEG